MTPWTAHADTSQDDQKRVALGYITEAWIEAVRDGVDPDHVAIAALEAAVRELVALRGEAVVMELIEGVVPRLARGEFSVHLIRQ